MLSSFWTQAQRAYAVREMALGAVISGALSILFVYLVFGGAERVTAKSLMWDAVPQSFMIVLMASLVPGLVTRAKIASGALSGRAKGIPSKAGVCGRAVLAAAVATALALILHALLLPQLAPDGASFTSLLVFKSIYGALLGLTAVALLMQYLFGAGARPSE